MHLDDRNAALGEEMRLVSADEATAEDDGEVGGKPLASVERPRPGVYLEARSLQLGDERGLARGKEEHPVAVRPHGGIFPAEPSFQAWKMGNTSGMKVDTLDHIALWVDERDSLADFLGAEFGMHVIERTDAFTLVGGDARRGKLTLFAADGPRERGLLGHIAIRVPAGGAREELATPSSVPLVAVETEGEPYDIDHVAFVVPDPGAAFSELASLGFDVEEDRLRAGGARIDLEHGEPADTERPLLNHLGLLVHSVDDHIREAERRGLEIDEVRDAANTYSLFLTSPSGIKLEYVEHKPTFSLV